jgi:DNA-binding LacI/PurR family transcriptional regulator
LRALNRAGRRVPDDVAVIGFDDIEPGRHADPPPTTVAQDPVARARLMAKLVLAQRDGHGDPGDTFCRHGWWSVDPAGPPRDARRRRS